MKYLFQMFSRVQCFGKKTAKIQMLIALAGVKLTFNRQRAGIANSCQLPHLPIPINTTVKRNQMCIPVAHVVMQMHSKQTLPVHLQPVSFS